jgi:hypothetical protein
MASDDIPFTWTSYSEAFAMFLRGATLRSASRIALVVGTWLSIVNHGELITRGDIPWIKIALDYATPFVVASLGFLAARRHANVERLARLLADEAPRSRPDRGKPLR